MSSPQIKQSKVNFSDISKTIKINNDLNSSSLKLKTLVRLENQKFEISKIDSILIIPESASPYKFSKKEFIFLRELFIICTIWVSVLFYIYQTKNECYKEESSEILGKTHEEKNIIIIQGLGNDFPIKYVPECTLADMFYIDRLCYKGQDFCTTFSSPLFTTKEKLGLLANRFHWMPTDKSEYLDLKMLEGLKNCTSFIGFSDQNIYLWALNSYSPEKIPISLPSLYKIAPNEHYLILVTQNAYIYKINIPSFSYSYLNSFFAQSIPSQFFISEDSHLIYFYYENLKKIDIFSSNSETIIRTFKGISGTAEKIVVAKTSNDLILKDMEGIKIYYIQENKPAYGIYSIEDYNSFVNRYYELKDFETFIK